MLGRLIIFSIEKIQKIHIEKIKYTILDFRLILMELFDSKDEKSISTFSRVIFV